MQQRLSLITLGVSALDRSVAFYGQLGWTPGNDWQGQGVAFFQCPGMILALWDREALAADSVMAISPPGAVCLAYNTDSPEDVDAVLAEAASAGATVHRSGASTDWGGYSGVFHDPDGHAWEVAHNPFWTLAEDGSISLNP